MLLLRDKPGRDGRLGSLGRGVGPAPGNLRSRGPLASFVLVLACASLAFSLAVPAWAGSGARGAAVPPGVSSVPGDADSDDADSQDGGGATGAMSVGPGGEALAQAAEGIAPALPGAASIARPERPWTTAHGHGFGVVPSDTRGHAVIVHAAPRERLVGEEKLGDPAGSLRPLLRLTTAPTAIAAHEGRLWLVLGRTGDDAAWLTGSVLVRPARVADHWQTVPLSGYRPEISITGEGRVLGAAADASGVVLLTESDDGGVWLRGTRDATARSAIAAGGRGAVDAESVSWSLPVPLSAEERAFLGGSSGGINLFIAGPDGRVVARDVVRVPMSEPPAADGDGRRGPLDLGPGASLGEVEVLIERGSRLHDALGTVAIGGLGLAYLVPLEGDPDDQPTAPEPEAEAEPGLPDAQAVRVTGFEVRVVTEGGDREPVAAFAGALAGEPGAASFIARGRPWSLLGVPASSGSSARVVLVAAGGIVESQRPRRDDEGRSYSPLSLAITEISGARGETLFDGPFERVSPVDLGGFRLLSSLLLVLMAMVLLIVLRPEPGDGVVAIPAGYALAEPPRRLLATFFDLGLAVLVASSIWGVDPRDMLSFEVITALDDRWLALPTVLLVGAGLGAASEWAFGRTFGKLVFGMTVVSIKPRAKAGSKPGTNAKPHGKPDAKPDDDRRGRSSDAEFDDRAESAPARRAGGEDDLHDEAEPPAPLGLVRLSLWQALVRNLVKWLLPPVAALALVDTSGRHRGDGLARAAVLTELPPEPTQSP